MSKSILKTEFSAGRGLLIVVSILTVSSCLLTAGCKNFLFRPQSPDDLKAHLPEAENNGIKYVGDICSIWGLNFAKVEGISLVTQLDGTGSDPDNNGQRNHLIEEMKAYRIDKPDEVLKSKNTSLAIVRGFLPPGIKKGERFDIEIRTLDRSDTTSLNGGYCMKTRLKPMALIGRNLRTGHVIGVAEGPVLIDYHFEKSDNKSSRVRGTMLGGGVATENRKLGLAIRSEAVSVRTSAAIAKAINHRFSIYDQAGKTGVAEAKNDRSIELKVPTEYKHNLGRFLQIVLNIAYDQKPEDTFEHIEMLERQLNEPAFAKRAALRLEAIGKETIGALRRGLNHQDVEVRFHSAQALAYLGNAEGIKHLEQAARKEPAFRWHALTALASLRDTTAGTALSSLMHVDSAETRYGAFRAMRARSPFDPLVEGKRVNDDFNLHVVPSPSDPMIHISRKKRREIVFFNDNQTVGDEFLFVQSGITAKTLSDSKVQIKQFLPNRGDRVITCSNKVSDVVEHLGKLGCDYGCIIDLLKDARNEGQLNSRLVVNAIPKSNRKRDRNQWNPDELPDEKSNYMITGPLPELFREGTDDAESNDYVGGENFESEETEQNDAEDTAKKSGVFDKIKGVFKR